MHLTVTRRIRKRGNGKRNVTDNRCRGGGRVGRLGNEGGKEKTGKGEAMISYSSRKD